MNADISISPKIEPPLDRGYVPPILWVKAFQQRVDGSGNPQRAALTLEREGGAISRYETRLLPSGGAGDALNNRYMERLVKFLLWARGGYKLRIAAPEGTIRHLQQAYSPTGERAFDHAFFEKKIYARPFVVEACAYRDLPESKEFARPMGGHTNGCRVGIDLGGSDRKCAAVKDGAVLHTEEVEWDPYGNPDPRWHYEGIDDSIRRAAEKLPRVDAIGVSAAGIYIDNQARVASLFRGVPESAFESGIRPIFSRLQQKWGGVPLVVANDGDVTALAGAMASREHSFLGIAMGTSAAGGYVDENGRITGRLNELAFVPVDFRMNAPVDEWSGDIGCGAQYFSQQAVARLIGPAGIKLNPALPDAKKLLEVQKLSEGGDERAKKIYETIGVELGYSIAWFNEFYRMAHVLLLGRVMTGAGGTIVKESAQKVLRAEFPDLLENIRVHEPSEGEKRHGQAVAAATLPPLDQR
ncbi:MAG: transcriptional regulator [Planctomycetes bacterium RBG_16_59_8]|nr:MAG: transcriptional regulator [Planctomycetes bacterium RBG_16_59_8]